MTPAELNDLCEKRLAALATMLNHLADDAALMGNYIAESWSLKDKYTLRFGRVAVALETGYTSPYKSGPHDTITGVAVQCVYPHDSEIRSVNTRFAFDAQGTVLGLSREKVNKIHASVLKAHTAFETHIAHKLDREHELAEQIDRVKESAPGLHVAFQFPLKGYATFAAVDRTKVTVNTDGLARISTEVSVPANRVGEALRVIEQLKALKVE